ncbi:MAG: RIP metalloprotease RseP [Pseudomonadales bacterium]|nr:RIP metalloprotease RseP [Pseudomonadales bacterium]MCP5182833.1 RIP metalloprotease RseP [Pseudomonadales bacterium]
MTIAHYLLAFLVTLGVLITVHELGHYWVARWSGVRILKFAVGFGRPIWKRMDRRGTEWVVAAIPLGGYVRMLDERDPDYQDRVTPTDVPFGTLHPRWRIAIALGGPGANFVLAVVAYWVLAVAGSTTLMPVLGVPGEGSPLAAVAGETPVAGMEIASIDGAPTRSWQEVTLALASRLGDSGEIVFGLREPGADRLRDVGVEVSDWQRGVSDPDIFGSLGIQPFQPAVIGMLEPGSPAERAGLRLWDRVERIDGQPIADWRALQKVVGGLGDAPVAITVARGGAVMDILVRAELRTMEDGERRVLGIGPVVNVVESGPLAAVPEAFASTWGTVASTLGLLKKMLTGKVSTANLSGPITISKVAGDSARAGWRYFVGVIAALSISLGILNLLPIPVLDGGHVIFAGAEWVRGKPLSERVQALGLQFGVVIVGGLMMLALFNDFSRILSG